MRLTCHAVRCGRGMCQRVVNILGNLVVFFSYEIHANATLASLVEEGPTCLDRGFRQTSISRWIYGQCLFVGAIDC